MAGKVIQVKCIQKGYWVAIAPKPESHWFQIVSPRLTAIRESSGKVVDIKPTVYSYFIGKVVEIDELGLRITMVDILLLAGGVISASSYDMFWRWEDIGAILVATPQHSLEGFIDDACWFLYHWWTTPEMRDELEELLEGGVKDADGR